MRRLLTLLTALLLSSLLFAPAMAAQDESDEAGTSDLLQSIPGLENAWAKRYDNPGILGHVAEDAEPADVSIRILSVTILEFESESAAEFAFTLALSEDTAGMILGVDDENLTSTEEVDIGDQATLFVVEDGDDTLTLLGIRDGNLGFLIMASGEGEDPATVSAEIGEFVVNGEPGEGEIVFEESGESHGGLFDLFPGYDDEDVLHGLIPMYEYNLLESDHPIEYPASPEASPEA